MPERTKAGLIAGSLAISAWSIWGLLLASNHVTPPLMSGAIMFSSAAIALTCWRLFHRGQVSDLFRIPLSTFSLGSIGLFGGTVLYPLSLWLGANPVTVNITYLSWPVFMVIFAVVFGISKPAWLDGIAMIAGLIGIFILATNGGHVTVNWQILPVLLSAVCWAGYSALRTKVPPGPPEAMLAFIVTSALLSWVCVAVWERDGTVPGGELLRLILAGVLPVGAANVAWDYAVRHTEPIVLASISFLQPIISTILIAVILSKPIGLTEIVALATILFAVLCSIVSEQKRRNPALPTRR